MDEEIKTLLKEYELLNEIKHLKSQLVMNMKSENYLKNPKQPSYTYI